MGEILEDQIDVGDRAVRKAADIDRRGIRVRRPCGDCGRAFRNGERHGAGEGLGKWLADGAGDGRRCRRLDVLPLLVLLPLRRLGDITPWGVTRHSGSRECGDRQRERDDEHKDENARDHGSCWSNHRWSSSFVVGRRWSVTSVLIGGYSVVCRGLRKRFAYRRGDLFWFAD